MSDILQPPGRTISYFPELTKVTGSIKAAILCQQVTYWTPREETAETWIDKREAEWLKETGFTVKEFRGACGELEERKLIDKEYDRVHHTLRIRLRIENYNAAIQELAGGQPLKVAPAKRAHAKKAHAEKAHAKKAHAKKAHAEREGGMYQKGTWQEPKGHVLDESPIKDSYESRKAEITTEGTTETDPPENANAFSCPQGQEHAPWMQSWKPSKRFPKDFPHEPPAWFVDWCKEHTPHVDVAHEWPYMLDHTFRSNRTQFFMVARRWMETEEEKRVSNGARASPRYGQRDTSPEAEERLRKKLQEIDEKDGGY